MCFSSRNIVNIRFSCVWASLFISLSLIALSACICISAYIALGMDPSDRVAAQAAWTSGRARICVATVAFGMGIDKANVRLVVHAALPRYESY